LAAELTVSGLCATVLMSYPWPASLYESWQFPVIYPDTRASVKQQ